MKKLKMKARAGVTLVELLVVMLIAAILALGLLPLLKPMIEQAKYASEVQPALGNIQTKISLYQYERDKLPGTDYNSTTTPITENTSVNDTTEYGWVDDGSSTGKARNYEPAVFNSGIATQINDLGSSKHLSNFIDVTWNDVTGRRLKPSLFKYHIIKGLGSAKYGFAIGVFGDGDGLALGTGYAIMVLVDTKAKQRIMATWERYSAKSDQQVHFVAQSGAADLNGPSASQLDVCQIPDFNTFDSAQNATDWSGILDNLKTSGWSFNSDDVQ